MKRWVAVVLIVLLLLVTVGCEEETQQDMLVLNYKQSAQKYITAGDLDTAIAILEDGLVKTNQNSELATLLEQIKAKQPKQEETTPTEVAHSGFAGYWESENYFMGIQEQEGKWLLSMLCYSENYDEYVIRSSIDASTATDAKATFPFEDDGYGSSGKVVLYLEGDTLNYVITDFMSAAEAGEEPYGIGIGCSGGSLQRTAKMPVPLESLEDSQEEEMPTNDNDIYVGEWADYISERATMTIVKTAGKYSIKIEWPDSAYETIIWTMTAEEQQEDGDSWLASTDCKKTITEYSEDGLVSKAVEYENGKAMIFYMDETLNWVDYTEYAGDDCCFEKIP